MEIKQAYYQIEWKSDVIQNNLNLQPQDVESAKKLFGDSAFALNRGNESISGLFCIDQPRIEADDYGGIDIPCLLKNVNVSSDKTIMVIGEAPRRKQYGYKEDKHCSFGTPYAIQYDSYPPQCEVYKDIFKCLLCEGYNLYLTDAIKMWTNSKQKNRKLLVPDDTEYEILKEVIEEEMPCVIVTFGRVAMDAVREL